VIGLQSPRPQSFRSRARLCAAGTQFTCFTGTKVQILTPLRRLLIARICAAGARRGRVHRAGTQFTSFTGTKVQILTQLRQHPLLAKVPSEYKLWIISKMNRGGGTAGGDARPRFTFWLQKKDDRKALKWYKGLQVNPKFTCFTRTKSTNTDCSGRLLHVHFRRLALLVQK
jgi:hypothetical protein